ncbi:MAG: aromatic amino acid transport family protein [Candidatus Woesearchaeota archaeon]|nr:aromatic amino acid transport family protein [Candidatus Woesearchaeota archaeon]MDP7324398.1 aromatic amino acid transport family protein [Candidatus Woesearchaeota archaeon]
MEKPYIQAVATYVGFVIGAGILGIPFVVAKAGFLTGLIDIILIGIIFAILNMYMGEIALSTKGHHQLPGYAKIYLGNKGKLLMSFSLIFGMSGSIIAYIVKGGEFLAALLQPSFGGNLLLYALLFFIPLAYLTHRGLKAVENAEVYMVSIILVIVVILGFVGMKHINPSNLTGFSLGKLFIPFGVVMFSFLGTGAIPEIREELQNHKHLMKKSIMTGACIVTVVYILFALIVIGISGEAVTDGAIIGLGDILGTPILIIGIIFGLLTMSTSFIAIGTALKESYVFDFKISEKNAFRIACFIPLAVAILILLSGITNAFFKILDITGIIAGGLVGFIIIPMVWKAKAHHNRKPEYKIPDNKIIEIAILIVFTLGILFEFIRILF